METRANYVLIGGFTLLASVFLLLFALWAAKFSSDRNWREYQVIFTEPVTGLTEGGGVQYNGISVGTVDKLSLAPDDARKVVALLKLKADAPVKVDTRAKLSQQGITGVPFIQLTGGGPQSARLERGNDGEIPIIRTEPSALQNIADTANRLVARMDQLLSQENINRISNTLDNLEQATGSIAGQKQDIAALIVNAREVTDGLKLTVGKANGAIDGVVYPSRSGLDRSFGQAQMIEETADLGGLQLDGDHWRSRQHRHDAAVKAGADDDVKAREHSDIVIDI